MAGIIKQMLGLEEISYSFDDYSKVVDSIETILEMPTKQFRNIAIGSVAAISLLGGFLVAHAVKTGTEWITPAIQTVMVDTIIGGPVALGLSAVNKVKEKLLDISDDMEKDAIIRTYNELFGFDLEYDMDKDEIIAYIADSMGLEKKDIFPLAAVGVEVLDGQLDVRDFYSKVGNLAEEKANQTIKVELVQNTSAAGKKIKNRDAIEVHLNDIFDNENSATNGAPQPGYNYKVFDYENDEEARMEALRNTQTNFVEGVNMVPAFDYEKAGAFEQSKPINKPLPKIINMAELLKNGKYYESQQENSKSQIDKLFDGMDSGESKATAINIKDLHGPEKE